MHAVRFNVTKKQQIGVKLNTVAMLKTLTTWAINAAAKRT